MEDILADLDMTEVMAWFSGDLDLLATIGVLITLVMFLAQQWRANRLEKQENYLKLELSSNDLFSFEAENADLVCRYDGEARPDGYQPDECGERRMAAFLFMTLNLFEISIRLRHSRTIDPAVFGSWVVWYYDTLTGWFFREQWPDIRYNYTPELRAVFDPFIDAYDEAEEDDARRKRFFHHVGDVLNCAIIRKWLEDNSGKRRP